MLLSWFSSNATPRIFVTTALLRSYGYDAPEAPGLWSRLVFFRPGVGDADQGFGGLAVLPQERREFLRRGRRRDHRLLVQELLELRLAEQRDEFAVEPRDHCRWCAARRRQTPPALP